MGIIHLKGMLKAVAIGGLVSVMALWLLTAGAKAELTLVPDSFAALTTGPDGLPLTQAGGHPNGAVDFALKTFINPRGYEVVDGSLKDVVVDLPAGFLGDPTAVPYCSPEVLNTATGHDPCPASQVGYVAAGGRFGPSSLPIPLSSPLYNMQPPEGQAAQLEFKLFRNNIVITVNPRTDGDYGLRAVIHDLPNGYLTESSHLVLWGVPADPVHDNEDTGAEPRGRASIPVKPFLSNPAACLGQLHTTITMTSWEQPDRWISADSAAPPVTGCELLRFTPSVDIRTDTTMPDSPTGLRTGFAFAQNTDPHGLATSPLRDVNVTLPDGLTINPGSADGLEACTDGQLGLGTDNAVSCPDAANIGDVQAVTPVLDDAPLKGSVYLRTQNSDDPASGDMFRIALVLRNAERGLLIKLPGQVKVDAATGRVVARFADNPQVPVSSIDLRLKSGPRAPLATPAACGDNTVDTQLTSWGGQATAAPSPVHVDCTAGLGGFTPSLAAGTGVGTAGAFAPFSLRITKPDGNAAVSGLSMSLPTGLLAQLRGNVGTQVGRVTAFAGPGSNPLALPGRVYLEGRYDDAPFSLRVVVPAQAGPFDLGDVVVRQKIYVDPIDAHVTVVSDPIPTIVKGVPVRLQRLDVSVDKPSFIINPTSCAAKTISATLSSSAGQSVPVTNHFQVSDCSALDLKPSLGLTLSGKGQTKDGGHPAISAVLSQPAGQANLKRVRVTLPLSLALDPDNAASDSLCSFAEGSKPDPQCPASSVVGKATAVSPILNEPLTGPVFFVKNERKDPKSGRSIKTTPKLVIPLVGENGVKLTLTGASTVVDNQLVTTFDNIPDAPVSGFKMDIIGGKKGILVISGDKADICKSTQVVEQQIDGQNGETADANVSIKTPSCPTKVLSKKVGKTSVAIRVGGLSVGKVTVTGKGIKRTTKTIAKSTVATITAKRTKGKPGKVTVSFDPAGPAKARKTTK